MNTKIEKALRKVKETQWVGGSNVQPTLQHALQSINFSTGNGGLYEPTAKHVAGIQGIFLVNKDGSMFYGARAIKQDDGRFLVEYLSDAGFNTFEAAYNALSN